MHAHLVNVGMVNLGQKPNLDQHANNNKCSLSLTKIMKLGHFFGNFNTSVTTKGRRQYLAFALHDIGNQNTYNQNQQLTKIRCESLLNANIKKSWTFKLHLKEKQRPTENCMHILERT
jgi:hypothetical protein